MPMQPDTRTILRTGLSIFGTGVLSAALMLYAFGGVGRQGPQTRRRPPPLSPFNLTQR